MVKSEILKEKVKRIVQSDDKPKIEFLTILASHKGSITSQSISTSFKRFNQKYGEKKFQEVRNEMVDEGIIFTSSSDTIRLAVKKEGNFHYQKGEELSKFIGKLIFEHSPRIKDVIERIFQEPEGREFLRFISEKKEIYTRDGEEPEIKDAIGKRSYEEVLEDLLEVGILTEYAWSSRKHYYHGYSLLPFVETYLSERLSPFKLSIIKKELEEKGLSGAEIYRCLEILRKIYVGQNIRSEGILQTDFSEYRKEIEFLTKHEFIKDSKWFFDQFLTTEKGSNIGKLMVENLIKERQVEITNAILSLPHNSIGFLLFDYMNQSLTYSVDKEFASDWREPLLADSRIWILRNRLLSKLEELGLCIKTHSYVSTRGGELRGEYYVICKEVMDFLKDCTAYKGGLFGKEKKTCLLYDFFRKAKRFLQIENIDEVRERYYNEMENLKLTEEEIEETVDKMSKKAITSEYNGLLSDKLPFLIKDESRYDIYLKEQLIKPVVHFLLEKPEPKIEIEAVEVDEERLEEVRRRERERIRPLGLTSREERTKLYDEISAFELELRHFIKRELEKKFGDLWLEKGVPQGLRKKWKTRKNEEIEEGIEPETEIINYADFSDYKKIIIFNWKEIFMSCFQDEEKLKVRLDDLNVLGRIPVMHIRGVNKEKIGVTTHAINWLRSKISDFETD